MTTKKNNIDFHTSSFQSYVSFPSEYFDYQEKCSYYLDLDHIDSHSVRFKLLTAVSYDEKAIVFVRTNSTGVFIIPAEERSYTFNLKTFDPEDDFFELTDALEISEEDSFVCFLIVPLLTGLMDSGIYLSNTY